MVASLLIGGVLLLAMVTASGRAAVVLPADARIAIHGGTVEHCARPSGRRSADGLDADLASLGTAALIGTTPEATARTICMGRQQAARYPAP